MHTDTESKMASYTMDTWGGETSECKRKHIDDINAKPQMQPHMKLLFQKMKSFARGTWDLMEEENVDMKTQMSAILELNKEHPCTMGDSNGQTLLHICATTSVPNGVAPMISDFIQTQLCNMVKHDKHGMSPLHIAARCKNWTFLKELIWLVDKKEIRIPDDLQWQTINECASIIRHSEDVYQMDCDEQYDLLFVAARLGMWRNMLSLSKCIFPLYCDFSHYKLVNIIGQTLLHMVIMNHPIQEISLNDIICCDLLNLQPGRIQTNQLALLGEVQLYPRHIFHNAKKNNPYNSSCNV